MRRYIDADALLQMLPDDLPYKASVKRILMQAPEADVAPKSEVASEIFAEIATILRHHDMLAERDKSEYGELIVMDIGCAISELKKKYTEVEQ